MEARPGLPERIFYTVTEVAAMTGLSASHIRGAIKRGDMPGRRIGEAYRISKTAFHAWAEERERPAANEITSRNAWS